MSRAEKKPIPVLANVEVTLVDGVCRVKGPKGEISREFKKNVIIALVDGEITVKPADKTILSRALCGTYASHIKNMMHGVSEGFEKKLRIEGVGYRAEVQGNKLVLNVGFSHPVEMEIPEGVETVVEKSNITVTGINKEVIGQFSANIRAVKKPEPYKGKGIQYVGEYIIRKQGKKAV